MNAAHIDNPQTAPAEEFKWLAEAGVLKIVLPGELLDFEKPDTGALLSLLKEVGKANLSVGRIFEGHVNALYLIHLYGTAIQKIAWYHAVRHGNALFGVWNTQAANGVWFNEDEQGLLLKGEKTFCSGVSLVTHALITGNIDMGARKGWQMTILDMSRISPEKVDRKSWQTLGMRASGSFTTDFTGYQVEEKELLGLPGDYLGQPYFNGGAIRFAAVQLGGIEAVLEQTKAYLQRMERTDDPFQKTRLASMFLAVNTGNLWLQQAGRNFDEWVGAADRSTELIAFANMTRTIIEEIGINVMQHSNQSVGARGLMSDSPLERLQRDLTFYLRQPAPDATRLAIADYYLTT